METMEIVEPTQEERPVSRVSIGNERAEYGENDNGGGRNSIVGEEDDEEQEVVEGGIQREEPLDSTFDKFRRASLSVSTTAAEEDDPSKMEEKPIGAGDEHPEDSGPPPLDQPKEPGAADDSHTATLTPLDRKKPSDLQQRQHPNDDEEDNDDDDDDDDEEDEADRDSSSHHIPAEGLYDPNEFINLPVGSDVKELFQFISAFTPQVIELDTALKPFILDYVPSVGDIDAFIKIPRPDDVEDNLGLIVLDEPCAKQSDPSVLDLHLRAASKDTLPKGTVVKRLARADRNPKEIENWIKSIGDLHKSKPATQVHYNKPMPDIDSLMQEWPPEVEEILKQIDLPSADLDQMPLEQYVDTVCALLDIPVYKSRIQSLHVLFTLYSEFKNSQHFRALAEENKSENRASTISAQKASGNTDRLVL